jgi:hypothetical protein
MKYLEELEDSPEKFDE